MATVNDGGITDKKRLIEILEKKIASFNSEIDSAADAARSAKQEELDPLKKAAQSKIVELQAALDAEADLVKIA